jgi:hypothetical protein
MSVRYGRETNYVLTCKLADDIPNVISDENFYGDVYGIQHYDSNFNIAVRLRALYPDAWVIVVFRKLDEWLKSLYYQFLGNPYASKHIKSFNEFVYSVPTDFKMFEQYKKVLLELFDGNVLSMQFKDLKLNQDLFIQKICNFMEVAFPYRYNREKTMVSLNKKQVDFLKIFPKLPLPKKFGYAATVGVRQAFRRWNK